MSLEDTRARLLAVSETAEGLLAQVNDLYVQEIRSEEKVLTEALSELHNSGEIDLVEIVRKIDKSSCGNKFFTILHAFENVLPSLDARVENVVQCLVHLTQQAGRDLAIGGVYEAFEHFCRMEANRPKDSVEFILTQSDLSTYAPFLSSSILAYDSDRVAEALQTTESLIVNSNQTVRNQAYFTLGRLDVNETQASVIWELLIGSASSERESGCYASILRATLHFGGTFPSYWSQIEELLITFVEGVPPEVLYAISDIVSFQRIDLPENVLRLLVKQLANVSPEHKGIIDNIDHLLVKLIERGSSSLAVELLESILAAGVEFASLDYLSNKLLNKHQELRNYIITKWFLYGEASLCHGVLDLLHDVTGEDIELKAETALLGDEVKQVFVSHKAVGWLFTRPIAAASFILSISGTASITTLKELERILYDPLLLSYPGELKQFFQSCIDKGVQEHLCERLLGKLKAYHADIEKVSELKELMAPNENVSAYWKDFDKDMQKAHEEASKYSFIRMIATTQRLLYGNSSIYYLHQGDGESIRQEMQMQSFSHSTEMPRLNVIDPESLDYILRIYRCERLKNEVNS
ncbi:MULTISPECIES: hypothetical protein [unclassified Brenneria]|uniref:hypothetical protein n=1 Tax=unclassified Brenneria TaxID=2634434 RepID=UPI0015573FF8|nr:hypothetical protein [Brenneria sp. hezel4-2-4]MEE3650510.1 hypothetical protein [Brenneria sp. HEZEL_4_2_4]NPD00465.1 hypothetical protein [Brenneria sp. hezel4-2-4]